MIGINNIKNIVNDKAFLRKAVAISIPVALQGLLNTTLNMVDTLMIGQLGETTISAVGLANKVFFVFALLLFGVVSGSSILTSQYWGKRDVKNIRRVLGISLMLGIGASILFLIPCLIAPKQVMRIFTPNSGTIAIGATYLAVVSLSYPLTAITNVYVTLLRGVNQVKAPVIITILSIGVNVTFNYMLIYGKLGAPELGVTGAAIATVLARVVECVVLLLYVYLQKGPAAASIKDMFRLNKDFSKKYASIVTPVIANEFMWGLGVTMYSLAYGRMGDGAVAAITITQTVEQVLTVIFQGISAATAVILGNEMGSNQLKRAERYAKNFIVVQFLFTLLMMMICYLIRWPAIGLFEVSNEVATNINRCFLMFIAYMPFKMFNYVNIVGILRSGGDTKYALFLDTSGVWLIGVPLAFIGGLVLDLPIYWVYAMVMIEEIYKFILGLKRYKKKKWLRNIVGY